MTSSPINQSLDYEKEFTSIRRSHSKTGCITSAALIILGFGLDYTIYPEQLYTFSLIRIAIASLTLLVMFFIIKDESSHFLQRATMLWLALPQIMIAWMIYKTNGSSSIYFVGLHLALYAVGIIVPLSYKEGIGFGIFTCLCYIIACYFNKSTNNNLLQFLAHLLFISFSAAISIICSYYNEMSRMKLFSLQSQIETKNGELEKTNRDLASIQGHMIQQEKMSALGTLSAGLLHELNNPVSFSMMAISMAQLEPEVAANAQLAETLVDAKTGMKRISDIVTDLKTFAYQKPGEDSNRLFLFENALRSATRLSSAELKDVNLQTDLPIDTHVMGDEPALIGVLINLLTNAALALRKSGHTSPFILTKAWHDNDPATGLPRLYVTVTDNGTGIKPEHLTRIFEPFFTTRDVGQGLGLGLAVSYSVIERHGSELKVKSEVGAWTEFSFDMPARGEM